MNALFERAAALGRVELVAPRHVIGKSTVESIQSGCVYGFSGQVDALVDRFQAELGDCAVVATGGLADPILAHSPPVQPYQPWLAVATLRDGAGTVQLFVSQNTIGDDAHAALDDRDLGDWIGAEGTVMKTKRGELSVKVRSFELLAKALRPLPSKWHGLNDVDTR